MIHTVLRTLSSIGLLFALYGCVGSKYISKYDGNTDDIAVINGNTTMNFTYWGMRDTSIHRINKSIYKKTTGDGFVLEPGNVRVVVHILWGDPLDTTEDVMAALVGYRGKLRTGNKLLEFNAEKGHGYIAKAYKYDAGVLGKGGTEYVWIEDAQTGELIVGEKPPEMTDN